MAENDKNKYKLKQNKTEQKQANQKDSQYVERNDITIGI